MGFFQANAPQGGNVTPPRPPTPPPMLGTTPLTGGAFDASGNWAWNPGENVQHPNSGTPGGGFNESAPAPGTPPPGVTIPVTPGDPTHGGMFDAQGRYIGPPAGGTAAGGGSASTGDPIDDWIRANAPAHIVSDPGSIAYWHNFIAQNGGVGPGQDLNYFREKINRPDTGGSSGGASGGGPGFGSFLAPYTGTYTPPVTNFQAPRGTDDPGFQFALQQGTDAIQRSAAAKGNLLTGGTLKDLASYTTGAALQDYAGAYNRALSTATFNNNTAAGAFGMNYDIFRNNQTDPFNKLLSTTSLGLNAADMSTRAGSSYADNLTRLGTNQSSNAANMATGYGRTLADFTTNQGNIDASGTLARNQNTTNAINTGANWFQNYQRPVPSYL